MTTWIVAGAVVWVVASVGLAVIIGRVVAARELQRQRAAIVKAAEDET